MKEAKNNGDEPKRREHLEALIMFIVSALFFLMCDALTIYLQYILEQNIVF
jgi:hypothetical protein